MSDYLSLEDQEIYQQTKPARCFDINFWSKLALVLARGACAGGLVSLGALTATGELTKTGVLWAIIAGTGVILSNVRDFLAVEENILLKNMSRTTKVSAFFI